MSDPDVIKSARDALRELIVGAQIVLTPDAAHETVVGKVQFVDLGEHVLQLAGLRRGRAGKPASQDSMVAGARVGFQNPLNLLT